MERKKQQKKKKNKKKSFISVSLCVLVSVLLSLSVCLSVCLSVSLSLSLRRSFPPPSIVLHAFLLFLLYHVILYCSPFYLSLYLSLPPISIALAAFFSFYLITSSQRFPTLYLCLSVCLFLSPCLIFPLSVSLPNPSITVDFFPPF